MTATTCQRGHPAPRHPESARRRRTAAFSTSAKSPKVRQAEGSVKALRIGLSIVNAPENDPKTKTGCPDVVDHVRRPRLCASSMTASPVPDMHVNRSTLSPCGASWRSACSSQNCSRRVRSNYENSCRSSRSYRLSRRDALTDSRPLGSRSGHVLRRLRNAGCMLKRLLDHCLGCSIVVLMLMSGRAGGRGTWRCSGGAWDCESAPGSYISIDATLDAAETAAQLDVGNDVLVPC